MKEACLKSYPPYDSSSGILEKADYRDSERTRGQGLGREKRTGRAQGLQGRGTVPCDTVMVDTRHHAFVKTL